MAHINSLQLPLLLPRLQALHIMSSGKGGQGEPDGADGQQAGSVDARLARLESHGYMAAARSNLELEAVLDNLKVGLQCTPRGCWLHPQDLYMSVQQPGPGGHPGQS